MASEFTDILDSFLAHERDYDELVRSFSDIRAHVAAIDLSKELAANEVLGGAAKDLAAFHDDMVSYLIGLAGNSEYRGRVRVLYRNNNSGLAEGWGAVSSRSRSVLSSIRRECEGWFPDMDWSRRESDDGSAEYLVLAKIDEASARLDEMGRVVSDVLEGEVPGIVEGWR